MILRSSIYMMHPKLHAPGICSVCKDAAQLKFYDSSSNETLGDCCINEAIKAEALLSSISSYPAHINSRK